MWRSIYIITWILFIGFLAASLFVPAVIIAPVLAISGFKAGWKGGGR